MRASLRLLFVVLSVVASVVVPLTPAAADSSAPSLLRIERTSAAQVGGSARVSLAVTATDEAGPGSGMGYARVTFEAHDAAGAVVDLLEVDAHPYEVRADGSTLAERVLTAWAAEGRYSLTAITLHDRAGNTTTYLRDGTVFSYPQASTAPPPHGLDFAAVDFSVVNPLSDTAVPTVEDLRPATGTVTAGEPLILTSRVLDDRSGPAELSVRYEGPSGVTVVHTVADPVLAAAGVTSAVLPRGAEGGTWRATYVRLMDHAGNGAFYYRDRTHDSFSPRGVRPHRAQPPLDLSALDVHVIAGVADAEAPTVTAPRREGPAQLRRGDDIVLSFQAHDASEVDFIDFSYADRNGHHLMVTNSCTPQSGSAVDAVPAGFDPGPVLLSSITVVDSLFNVRQYRRDGSVWTQGRSAPDDVPGFDLSAMDFELVDGPPAFSGRQPTRYGCSSTPQLPVEAPASAPVGAPVDIAGQVLTADDVPVTQAAVGVFASPAGQPAELVSLTQTDAGGRFRVPDVMGSSDTTYRVRFLGRDGAAGGVPTTGAPRLVRVHSAAPTLTLTPTTISAGQVMTVSYRGTPGSRIDVLSRTQPATAFSRIGTVVLDARGLGTSTHRPQKNTRMSARTAQGVASPYAPLVTVRSVATLTATRVAPRRYSFTGRVYPGRLGRLVSLYRNGVLVGQGRTDAGGLYRITRTFRAGTAAFQVRTSSDQDNLGTSSRRVQLLVR